MQISELGKNLNIVIPCDYSFSHNWMSFICWYSISKNLPEANVIIVCNRKKMSYHLFSWTKRCKVKLIINKDTDLQGQISCVMKNDVQEPILVVSPDTVCIRDLGECKIDVNLWKETILANCHSDILSNCKDSNISLFASYREGWGAFVTSKWIDKESCPLVSSLDFKTSNMTVNESRLRKIWNSAIYLFNNVSGG